MKAADDDDAFWGFIRIIKAAFNLVTSFICINIVKGDNSTKREEKKKLFFSPMCDKVNLDNSTSNADRQIFSLF